MARHGGVTRTTEARRRYTIGCAKVLVNQGLITEVRHLRTLPMEGGWLVWIRAGTLVTQRQDVERAVLTGTPVTLADGVGFFSVAATTGQLAYRAGGIAGQQQLIWVDRSGRADGTVGVTYSDINGVNPRVSADGRRVALGLTTQANTDIWCSKATVRAG